ncbi:MAG: pitrilysin family protein [Acidobacteriota bacterium]
MTKSAVAVLAGLFILSAGALAAQTQASPQSLGQDIQTRTLKNGMKIIVWPDFDIPNVVTYDWFHVGSRNEHSGITGISHFFEHMMFNGAAKYGPGDLDNVMEANGGANNAFTSADVTVYQDWFPRSALNLIFDIESDRISSLALDPKMIKSEREVVYSERRSSVDNNNSNLLSEQIQSAAFVAHPYHIPTIGWPSDIESWSREQLVQYFKTYYAPNNATLIVVGAVQPKEVFDLAEKYIEPVPSHAPPDPVSTKEPEQPGERRVIVRKSAQTPLYQEAYHISSGAAADRQAIQLLLAILTRGDSSRLNRSMVEDQQIAIDVSSSQDNGFDPGLAWFYITLPAAGDLAKNEALLHKELDAVVKDGVSAAELRKAKNLAIADFWRSLKTINGKAAALGQYETFYGGYQKLFDAPAAYESITREQIQKAAAMYFKESNRTVGLLIPTEEMTEAAKKETSR